MSAAALVFLFPGQGAYAPGTLRVAAQHYAVVEDTLTEIESVSRQHLSYSVRELLTSSAAPELNDLLKTDPGALHMAIFAASVCAYRVLEASGCEPGTMVGHSFGEIAALVCADAFTVKQGAEIVLARAASLKPAAGSGYMAVVAASPRRCSAIVELLETPRAGVAADNGPNQAVMSGSTAAMDRVGAVAQALGIGFTRLASPYPFHSSQLVPVAKAFRTAIAHQSRKPTRVPVYSPILERTYEDKDDLTIALSSHLVRPVRFAATVRHLRQSIASPIFIEMGASNDLISLVRKILNETHIPALGTLSASGDTDKLNATLAELKTRGLLKVQVDLRLLRSLVREPAAEEELIRFWQARGPRIVAQVAQELARFRRPLAQVAPIASTPDGSPALVRENQNATGIPELQRVPVLREVVGEVDKKNAGSASKPPVAHEQADGSKASHAVPSTTEEIIATDIPGPGATSLSAASHSFPAEEVIYCEAVNVPPVPSNKNVARPSSRDALYREIVAAFAEATGYPAHVFTEEAALDTTLAIDSLKQMEVLSELEARYQLPACLKLFRSGEQGTLRKITDFVYHAVLSEAVHIDEHITAVPLPTVAPAFVPSESDTERQRLARLAQSAPRPGAHLTRAALLVEIVAVYAEAMGYPPEVFAEDVRLDTELGIDSVKQMELFSKLETRYQLPARPETFRLSDYGTLRKVTDFVYHGIGRPARQRTERPPVYAVG